MMFFSKTSFSSKGLALSGVVFFVVTVAYILLSYQQWVTAFVPTYDLGIFTQLTRAYAALQAPIVPIKNVDFNLLGDHFHPLLVVMAPIYAVFPSAFTLLVIQAVLFGFSSAIFGYCLYKIFSLCVDRGVLAPAGFKAGPTLGQVFEDETVHSSFPLTWKERLYTSLPYIGSLGGGLAYGLSWGLQNAQFVQFHEIAWAVLLVSLGLYYFVCGNYSRASLWFCLIVFVKEDLGLTVALFGLIIIWRVWRNKAHSFPLLTCEETTESPSQKKLQRSKQWFKKHQCVYGAFLVMWGIFWLWFSTTVFLPAINENAQYGYTEKTGVSELIYHPVQTIGEILTNEAKIGTSIVIILMVAGGVFFSPLVFLAAPTLGWRFLSPESLYWSPGLHYDALIMPIAFFCVADFLCKIYVWADPDPNKSSEKVEGTSSGTLSKKTIQEDGPRGHKVKKALSYYGVYMMLPIVIIVAAISVCVAPVHSIFITSKYKPNAREKSILEVADMVPENSLIATDIVFMNYLVDSQSRMNSGADPINTLYWARRPPRTPPDYIALDMDHQKRQHRHYSNDKKYIDDLVEVAQSYHTGTRYKLVYDKNNIQLAKRID